MRGVVRLMLCFWAVTGLLGMTGCGPSVGRPMGKITMMGQPVSGAELKFVASDDSTKEFFGQSSVDGNYAVSFRQYAGLPVGTYTVTVTTQTLLDGKPIPSGEQGAVLKNDPEKTVKRAYRFDATIATGGNPIDFELSKGQVLATK